jgi:hypothetical protein
MTTPAAPGECERHQCYPGDRAGRDDEQGDRDGGETAADGGEELPVRLADGVAV